MQMINEQTDQGKRCPAVLRSFSKTISRVISNGTLVH